MDAFALPKDSAEEKTARSAAIQAANKHAAEIPLRVMQTTFKSYEILTEMAKKGNPASISDVGVGLLAVRACVDGAAMNVRINLAGLKDKKLESTLQEKVRKLSVESESRFNEISQVVASKLG